MTLLRVQHEFLGKSGLAEDVFVNTFYFEGATGSPENVPGLVTLVEEFYLNTQGGQRIADYMSHEATMVGTLTKVYDMSTPKPRVPIFEHQALGALGLQEAHQPLPAEVALCMSYNAALASGATPARRRGRIYLGPWNVSALGTVVLDGSPSRPDSILIGRIIASAVVLEQATRLIGHIWSQFSPTLDLALPIVRVDVDDSWDTQRRRGTRATATQEHLFV